MRPDPVATLKRQLGDLLARELAGWRATDVCVLIGTDAPRVSDLRHGRLRRFSLETLIRFADRMRFDVGITTRRRKIGRRAAGSV